MRWYATAVALLLLCSPLLASEEPVDPHPAAGWLNDHSHEVMQGALGMMLLVGDYDTVEDAGVIFDGMVFSLAATESLKLVIDEPRPNDPAATDGFPSSHASGTFAFAHGIENWRSDWGPIGYAFAAGVGWARVEEGYHTPEQVLAGAAIGLWVAGASLHSDGFVIHRGDDPNSLLPMGEEEGRRPLPAEGSPVVLWKSEW
jgi:hypothetical protein